MRLYSLDNTNTDFNQETCNESTLALETGSVIFLPKLAFHLQEADKVLLSPDMVKPGTKNISYLPKQKLVRGMPDDSAYTPQAASLLARYVDYATNIVDALFPNYKGCYHIGKTSLRPVEIKGRESSYRKDDTRLHVDAFPSNPNHGMRLLRVFCNINPNNQPRHWRVGEPFNNVANKFLPKISKPFPGKHVLLKAFGITKRVRTDYDHYMLHMHNRMKADMQYQKYAEQSEILFPPETTWIVFTDLVSHAAMSGQYVLEQTFYLPIDAMKYPDQAPLRILESMMGRKLA